MPITLFHRTTIADARSIVKNGFRDRQWDLGILETKSDQPVSVTGVWLSARPLSEDDGVEGDAQLQVDLDTTEDELEPFELPGLLWNTRFWVAPAEFLNSRVSVRILEVDPNTSWFDDVWDQSDGGREN